MRNRCLGFNITIHLGGSPVMKLMACHVGSAVRRGKKKSDLQPGGAASHKANGGPSQT